MAALDTLYARSFATRVGEHEYEIWLLADGRPERAVVKLPGRIPGKLSYRTRWTAKSGMPMRGEIAQAVEQVLNLPEVRSLHPH